MHRQRLPCVRHPPASFEADNDWLSAQTALCAFAATLVCVLVYLLRHPTRLNPLYGTGMGAVFAGTLLVARVALLEREFTVSCSYSPTFNFQTPFQIAEPLPFFSCALCHSQRALMHADALYHFI